MRANGILKQKKPTKPPQWSAFNRNPAIGMRLTIRARTNPLRKFMMLNHPNSKNLCRRIHWIAFRVLCVCQVDNCQPSISELKSNIITILSNANCTGTHPVKRLSFAKFRTQLLRPSISPYRILCRIPSCQLNIFIFGWRHNV